MEADCQSTIARYEVFSSQPGQRIGTYLNIINAFKSITQGGMYIRKYAINTYHSTIPLVASVVASDTRNSKNKYEG